MGSALQRWPFVGHGEGGVRMGVGHAVKDREGGSAQGPGRFGCSQQLVCAVSEGHTLFLLAFFIGFRGMIAAGDGAFIEA